MKMIWKTKANDSPESRRGDPCGRPCYDDIPQHGGHLRRVDPCGRPSWGDSRLGGDKPRPYGIALALFILLLSSCAKDMPPPGGPPDKTPPDILATTPAPGATLVDRSAPITVEFSERINGKAIGNALFISPPLKVEPTVRVKGARLRIEPNEPLDSGRTYVVTIGASLQDLQGNKLTASKTIAFSTGEQIDSGAIVGRIHDKEKPAANFRVFAFENDSLLIDSLFTRIPDYITETGSDGSFAFANMKEADYLVLGVEDKDRDNRLSRESERVALPHRIVAALPPETKPLALDLYLSRHDSTELSIINCLDDNRTIVMQFAGQKLDPSTLDRTAIRLVDSTGREYAVDAAMIFTAEPERVYLWSDSLTADREYTVHLRGLRGEEGKRLPGDSCSCKFRYRGIDEQAPSVKERTPSGNLSTIYPDDSLKLFLSEPVTVADSALLIAVDSVTTFIGTLLRVPGTTNYAMSDFAGVPPNRSLKAIFRVGALRDLSGNRGADTVYTFSLLVASPDSLGSLSGTLETPIDEEIDLRFVGTNRKREYRLDSQISGVFSLKLYPDLYRLLAFEDRNGNHRWDYGTLVPFALSERGWIAADSVRVRARFDHEDFRIKLE